MARTSGFNLADRILGGHLKQILTDCRSIGWSYDKISRELYRRHDLELSPHALRRWWLQIEAEGSAPDGERLAGTPLDVVVAIPAAPAAAAPARASEKPQKKKRDHRGDDDAAAVRGRGRAAHGGTVSKAATR